MTQPSTATISWRAVWGRAVAFVRANTGKILLRAGLAALVGWLINVYLMAVRYEGFAVAPGALATGQGAGANARLYWGILSTILFALWGYGRRVGFRELGSKLIHLPALAVSVFTEGPSVAALALWGGAVSLVVAVVIGPAVAGLVGVGFLVLAPSPLSSLIGNVIRRLWSGVLRAVGPGSGGEVEDPFLAGLAPGIGTALGMLVAWRVTSTPLKVFLALAAVVAAYLLLSRRATPGQAATAVLWVAAGAVAWEVMQGIAWADDGGWTECGFDCTWVDWAQSPGADEVLTGAAQGGVMAGGGAVIGSSLGEIAADLDTDGSSGGGDVPPRPDTPPPSTPETRAPSSDGSPTVTAEESLPLEETEVTAEEPMPLDEAPSSTKPDELPIGGGIDEDLDIPPRPDTPPPGFEDESARPDDEADREADTGEDQETGEATEETDDHIPDEDRWRYFPSDDRPTIERAAPGPAGQVLVDGEWVDINQVEAGGQLDQEWLEARRHGQELVERFDEINQRLQAATDPAERARLQTELRQAAVDINADMPAKLGLKGQGRTDLTRAIDSEIQRIYGDVDPAVIARLNEMGVRRGGREFRGHDMYDIRNASSAGTVGADRDIALNEARQRDLESRLASVEPGSPEANRLQSELQQVRASNQITVDYDRLVDHLQTELAGEAPDSPRAQHLERLIEAANQHAESLKPAYLADLDRRIAEAPEGSSMRAALEAERVAAEGRLAGTAEAPMSSSRWNDIAQDGYNQEYSRVTGTNADQAYQALTQRFNPEAYRDLGVLTGDPSKFDAASAEQTAGVSRYKTLHNEHMAEQGHITEGHALQEDARGYAKDMGTKTLPMLRNDPNVSPEKFDQLNRIQQVFERAGRGEILPSQIDAELQRAVPEIEGMTMDRATRMADTALEAGIKSPTAGEATGPSRIQSAFGRVSDLATINNYAQQHMAAGMNQGEATALATAQTLAGNAASESGLYDPRLSMAGGALLPNGMSNVLPDQAVENVVGTTYQGGRAALESAYDTYQSGELNTDALDRFVDSIDERPGVDPYKGIAQAADLMGEEVTRAGGNEVFSALDRLTESGARFHEAESVGETLEAGAGMVSDAGDVAASGLRTGATMASNLAEDLNRVYETGAGSEVLNESMSDFQQRVSSGEFSAPLQGVDHVARIASETIVDPGETLGQFAEDVSNIYEHGVGEGYWEEVVDNTEDALSRTPLVGQVVEGYNQLATGVGESGWGFPQEMAEGAYYLAEETATGAVEYIRSFW